MPYLDSLDVALLREAASLARHPHGQRASGLPVALVDPDLLDRLLDVVEELRPDLARPPAISIVRTAPQATEGPPPFGGERGCRS